MEVIGGVTERKTKNIRLKSKQIRGRHGSKCRLIGEAGTWFIISDYICLVEAVTVASHHPRQASSTSSTFTILSAAFITLTTFDYISSISFVEGRKKEDNLAGAKCQFSFHKLELSFPLMVEWRAAGGRSEKLSYSIRVTIKSSKTQKVNSIFNTFKRSDMWTEEAPTMGWVLHSISSIRFYESDGRPHTRFFSSGALCGEKSLSNDWKYVGFVVCSAFCPGIE